MSELCYCGSGQTYDQCCGLYLTGDKWPETPEKCMRARYSAYATHNIDFIKQTQSPEHRDSINWEDTKKWSEDSIWTGLEIVNSDGDQVEFIAHYEIGGKPVSHHERSTFVQEDSKWYFDDGTIVKETIQRVGDKVGRNDPCPCGSGKKYKKCCLK